MIGKDKAYSSHNAMTWPPEHRLNRATVLVGEII